MPRPNVAARKIERVGYERLRIYFIARRQTHLPLKPFRAGTTYNQILNLYAFDRKLRALCFDACGDLEIAFRNSMSEVLSSAHGSHPAVAGRDAGRGRLLTLSAYGFAGVAGVG